MRLRPSRLVRLALAAGTILALLAVPAPAQDQKEDKPFEEPGITYLPRHDQYIEWIAGTVIIVACLVVAFKNPHRSHMD